MNAQEVQVGDWLTRTVPYSNKDFLSGRHYQVIEVRKVSFIIVGEEGVTLHTNKSFLHRKWRPFNPPANNEESLKFLRNQKEG